VDNPSQKILVNRYINWELIEARLNKYPNIKKLFPIEVLRQCEKEPPFYTHYLAWRLGTWGDESWFEYFDKLLENCSQIPGWNVERIPRGCEFEIFWSFLWELQVAATIIIYFGISNCSWMKSGPDLKVEINGNILYVECTVPRKSLGIEEYIEDLLKKISPKLFIHHIPCCQFTLPHKQSELDSFLNDLFTPLLNEEYLENKLLEAQKISPLELPIPKEATNLFTTIEDDNPLSINYMQPWTQVGDPEKYLEDAITKVLSSKARENNLGEYHPNILVINFLLGEDFQLSRSIRAIPPITLRKPIDSILMASCGIDKIPISGNIYIIWSP
jgi:hypothetical protein